MANYLYANSRAYGLQGRSDHPALLRTSPSVWNISPGYSRSRVAAPFEMSYNVASIYQYNTRTALPTVSMARMATATSMRTCSLTRRVASV
jgi:hypothetical protein